MVNEGGSGGWSPNPRNGGTGEILVETTEREREREPLELMAGK